MSVDTRVQIHDSYAILYMEPYRVSRRIMRTSCHFHIVVTITHQNTTTTVVEEYFPVFIQLFHTTKYQFNQFRFVQFDLKLLFM